MVVKLSEGAIARILAGEKVEKPIFQVLSEKKISGGNGGNDRYRIMLSDGVHMFSSAMLATQLNHMVTDGTLCSYSVIQLEKFMCNTIQPDKRVMILLALDLVASGKEVGEKIGSPVVYKVGANNNADKPAATNESASENAIPKPDLANRAGSGSSFYGNKQQQSSRVSSTPAAPNTPGGSASRVYPIASLTPYQNKWTIKARVSQKSNIRTWSNSRGEGKLFSVNFLDESGEIRATAFTSEVDKFYDMLEVNKVYFVSRGTLKMANKKFSSVDNDYEITFSAETTVTRCEEEGGLPTMNFNFVPIDQLQQREPQSMVDVIGIVRSVGDASTIVGKQSNKEITKRDVSLVDKSGVQIRLTLWGTEAQNFKVDMECPVLAIKGAKLSDWGGRSLSALSSSMVVLNPDSEECFALRGWYDADGRSMDFSEFRGDGAASSSGTNWKTFTEAQAELGGGEKADYYTVKATVIFARKENCMYTACPTSDCNKKVIDQGNGMYRCEKCNKEYDSFKYRLILSLNLLDHGDNQWVTCFQDSAEYILGISATELGSLRDDDQDKFDKVFSDTTFKSYIFKLRAKMETYNDENRLKTVCVDAKPVNHPEYNKHLIELIEKMSSS